MVEIPCAMSSPDQYQEAAITRLFSRLLGYIPVYVARGRDFHVVLEALRLQRRGEAFQKPYDTDARYDRYLSLWRMACFENICSQIIRNMSKPSREVQRNKNFFLFKDPCMTFQKCKKYETPQQKGASNLSLIRFDAILTDLVAPCKYHLKNPKIVAQSRKQFKYWMFWSGSKARM